LLGTGEKKYHTAFEKFVKKYPTKFADFKKFCAYFKVCKNALKTSNFRKKPFLIQSKNHKA
ncbi:MAG: hypothetical protein K2Q18_12070, partial [Bdellovibrionales bacterium]|nr:hypothetical protein [Bdellovibrionales bacterium]